MKRAAELASAAIGATVHVGAVHDPADGSTRFAVAYESKATRWSSRHRFPEVGQAEAGAVTLADYLGAEVRL